MDMEVVMSMARIMAKVALISIIGVCTFGVFYIPMYGERGSDGKLYPKTKKAFVTFLCVDIFLLICMAFVTWGE